MQLQKLTKQQKWVMGSMSSGFMLENMDVMFVSFALSSMIADLHLSGGQAGWISSITNIGMLVGGVIFGLIADRIGRIKTFNYTVLLFALGTTAMSFANQIELIYVLRFITGLGAGGEYGVAMALIAENFPKKQVGKVSSIGAVGGQLGAMLAAIAAAVILPGNHWHALFLLGLIPVVLTLFVRRHVKETPRFAKDQPEKASLALLFNTPKRFYTTLALMVMAVVQIAGYFGMMNWLPTMMQHKLGLSISGSSIWMVATIAGMSVGMLVFGSILDKFGPRVAFGGFLIGSALMVYGLTLAHTMWTLVLAGAMVGFFSNGMFGGYGAVISSLYPEEIRATANNVIINTGRAIGGFSSVIIGMLMAHHTMSFIMGGLSGMYLISFVVMLTVPGLKQYLAK
ncbi:MFS family permease [Weissella uvarum]|uniref:MFS transporter n=1 Tax=Weissella uvarum TaxID=1479233 RepID=UPI0019615439|nr:MFS transporter [Weissella uvarum]MBM7618134.1 MFS family permease [Weissella uvarum]MCM0595124.1 MFS transporter [Weissella uvarum]